jgi:hypothetical protein
MCVEKDTKYVEIVTYTYGVIFKDPFKSVYLIVTWFGLYLA